MPPLAMLRTVHDPDGASNPETPTLTLTTPDPATPVPVDITTRVAGARAGVRSAVEALIGALQAGELLIPLAKPIEGVAEGERVELTDELSLSPHLLVDDEGGVHVVVFTEPAFAQPIAASVGWTTGDGEFSCCHVPALLALDVALELIDDQRVTGLVINPGHHSELFLRRSEVASLRQGKAIPLVGYVQQLDPDPTALTLEADPGQPPTELLAAIGSVLTGKPEVRSFALRHMFNPERDLEPHPTLLIRLASADVDRQTLAQAVIASIEEHLPPPGYIDILFEAESEPT